MKGRELRQNNCSYDILDKANVWHTVGVLKRRTDFEYQFEICPFNLKTEFIPLMDWHDNEVFRITPGHKRLPENVLSIETDNKNDNEKMINKLNVANSDKEIVEVVKSMFTHPRTGEPLTYSQMRHLYG